jgi:predicted dehydrogenase
MRNARPSRRELLKIGAAASTVFAVPLVIPRRAFGANERVVTGHIGLGGQGRGNLNKFLENCAAICDVDRGRIKTVATDLEKRSVKFEAFDDYRKLLDRKDIDAVVISTPDHWHALQTIHACEAGKDVYCEKPLTLTIAEGRKMVEAARKSARIVQTGSQQRSGKGFRTACEYVRSGRLGKIEKILVGLPACNAPKEAVADSDPPPELNYDMWLGPAPSRPYNKNRVHYNFRFFWDYSGGQMTNFGAHDLDIAQWALGMDESGPISSEGTASFDSKKIFEVSDSCLVTHTYANGVKVIVGQKQPEIPGGVTIIGEKGKIQVNRARVFSEPAEIVNEPLKDSDVKLYASDDHHRNFLECIKTREKPICDVEIGHRSATVCHLGNIAIRLGRKINWDPAKEVIVGDEDAASWVSRPYRAPWTLG